LIKIIIGKSHAGASILLVPFVKSGHKRDACASKGENITKALSRLIFRIKITLTRLIENNKRPEEIPVFFIAHHFIFKTITTKTI